MKYFLSAVLGVFICIIAAAFLVPSFVDLNSYKDQIAQEAKAKTGLDLKINGDIDLALLPSPRFMAGSVVVTELETKTEILSFERFDVNLNLIPLLQGEVSIESVTLIKPDITVITDNNGRLVGYTNELEQLVSGKGEGDNAHEQDNAAPNKSTFSPNISLNNIRISDGSISYIPASDEQKKQSISKINLDMKANDMFGPFSGQGSFFYDGRAIGLAFSTGVYQPQENLIELDAQADIEPENLALHYKGVLSFGGGVSGQGRISVAIDSENLVSQYQLPLATTGEKNAITLGGLLSFDMRAVECASCALDINGQIVNANLRYDLDAGQSVMKLKSAGALQLSRILSGVKTGVKTLEFDTSVTTAFSDKGMSGDIGHKGSFIKLDDYNVEVSGSYKVPQTGRPFVGLNTVFSTLDLRSAKQNGKKNPSNETQNVSKSIKSTAGSLNLPFDLALNTSIEQLKADFGTLNDVHFNLEALTNKLIIKDLAVAGEHFNVNKGALHIQDLKNLSAMSAYAEIQVSDLPMALKEYGADASSVPSLFSKGEVKVQANGSLDALEVTVNSKVNAAEFIVQGNVTDPLGAMSLSNTAVQVKHANAAQFVKAFSGSDILGKRYTKALDFYTKLDANNGVYELNNIRADISGVDLSGNMSVNTKSSRPSIEGQLSMGRLIIGEAKHSYKSASSTKTAKASASKWSKDNLNLTGLNDFDMNLNLKAKAFHYSVWPIEDLAANITLNKGDLTISETQARIFDGAFSIDANAKLPQKDRQPVYVKSSLGFERVNLEGLSKALMGQQRISLKGIGSMNVNVETSGSSQAALVKELNGEGSIDGSDIILDGVDLLKFAYGLSADNKISNSLEALWSGAKSGGTTKFDTLDGAFKITKGNVAFSKMELDGERINISTAGGVNIPEWTLNTKHTITVKEEGTVEPFDVTLNGPLDDPSQTFGKGLLNDFLNRKLERKLDKILSNHTSSSGREQESSSSSSEHNDTSQNQKRATEKDIAKEVIKGVLGDLLR